MSMMNTNAYSISTPLKALWKWDDILRRAHRAGRPIVILLGLIQFFLNTLWGRRREKVLDLPSIWFGNKWIHVFLASTPKMRQSVIEGQKSTYVSLCDREITLRWQKASATSITCTVLPAIRRSLKAILKWFRKGNFSLPQWSEVLSTWLAEYLPLLWFMAKDCPILMLFFLPHPHLSLYPSIYVFFICLCWYWYIFNYVMFAIWHHIKGETTMRIATVH